jgi:hypothetical protein
LDGSEILTLSGRHSLSMNLEGFFEIKPQGTIAFELLATCPILYINNVLNKYLYSHLRYERVNKDLVMFFASGREELSDEGNSGHPFSLNSRGLGILLS